MSKQKQHSPTFNAKVALVSLKYDCLFFHAREPGSEAKVSVDKRINFYKRKRSHSALGRMPRLWSIGREMPIQTDQQEGKIAYVTLKPVQGLGRSSELQRKTQV